MTTPSVFLHTVVLNSGRKVSLFINLETGLVVIDVIRNDDRGGNEVVRLNANSVKLPTERELNEAEKLELNLIGEHDEESE